MQKCNKNCKHYGGDLKTSIWVSLKAGFRSFSHSKWLLSPIIAWLLLLKSRVLAVKLICLLVFAFMVLDSLIIVFFMRLSYLRKLVLFSFLHLHHRGYGFHGMLSKSTLCAMSCIKRASVFLPFNCATKIRIKELRMTKLNNTRFYFHIKT